MPSFAYLKTTMPEAVLVAIIVFITFLIGLAAARAVLGLLTRIVNRSTHLTALVHVQRLRPPVYTVVPVLLIFLALRLTFPEELQRPFFSGLVKISSVSLLYWLAIRIVDVVSLAISKRYDMTVKDNLVARQVHTQIVVVRRIVSFLIFLVALAAIFLLFSQLRAIGVSLLASAGVAGIILGFAAQKTLGNLFAGIVIALTQPIRLEDAVVVEGEWGWVEEITLAYVVIRLWDLRRLILPIGYLLENPFQNWTRTSANIIGTVMLYADYTMPIDPLRKKLEEIVKATPLWDKKVQVVQVTDVTDQVMSIRALVSATDSSLAWDLRCLVREQLLSFMQTEYPHCLPKRRGVLEGMGDTGRPQQEPHAAH
ncbi:mechanosensitive ion channel domain-containing protein [Asticcacaulis sp. EMRT-3]|uniref:mechanosensitive ion channel family protein n=1 Tax=Asticcacaulis sp. EMRT-3 TaxID=3040349 RepID=UPI0024AE952E|nr:mechanosensitive ion channel domain-containing protein [Asticcacaulis sp. EMRT-3]MDI7773999.1 mechanosensitive ion channel [Asticcacaulis sp. EMRT-3]